MTKRDQRRYQRWAGTFHRRLPAKLRGRVCWDEVKHYFFTGVRPEAAAVRYAESKARELNQCV